jgi:probable rRNA maturation factor
MQAVASRWSSTSDQMARTIRFTVHEIEYKLRDQQILRDWLLRVAAAHKAGIASLSYILVSDEFLLSMNQEYLQHDTLTDIITFPDESSTREAVVGEIYISVERVRENAVEFGVEFTTELRRVMAHGLLHLLGFKDKSAKEIKEMRAAEDAALVHFSK